MPLTDSSPANGPLIIVPVVDIGGDPGNHINAKLLVSSLTRSLWSGDILVVRATPQPLFKIQRRNVDELLIPQIFVDKRGGQIRDIELEGGKNPICEGHRGGCPSPLRPAASTPKDNANQTQLQLS